MWWHILASHVVVELTQLPDWLAWALLGFTPGRSEVWPQSPRASPHGNYWVGPSAAYFQRGFGKVLGWVKLLGGEGMGLGMENV